MLRLLLLAAVVAAPPTAHAASEAVLYMFHGGMDGANPYSRLVADAAGDLFGTTSAGGGSATCDGGCGTVYELTPGAHGTYTETVLHRFSGGTDGASPAAPLSQDASGNFYGTTTEGGGDTAFGPYGCGTIFEITALGSYSVIHSFACKTEGDDPAALLYRGGNFNGSARTGGGAVYPGGGSLFVLTPGAGGTWTFSVVDRFRAKGITEPVGDMVFGLDGKLYSESSGFRPTSGGYTDGNVFSANPANIHNGNWFNQSIANFIIAESGSGGAYPSGGLLQESDGALIASTSLSASVFRLTKPSSYPRVPWTKTILHTFQGSEPTRPLGRPIENASGDIFGTGESGGAHGYGGVWELIAGDGGYTETTLHSFTGGADGGNPVSGLIANSRGILYGTTWGGGAGYGVVYRIAP